MRGPRLTGPIKARQHPLFRKYTHMKFQQKHYGAECEWNEGFWRFVEDIEILLGEYPPGYHLIRRDQTRGWTRDNVLWGTSQDRAEHLPHLKKISYRRKTKTIKAWSEETGISVNTLYQRFKSGWLPKFALNIKPDVRS